MIRYRADSVDGPTASVAILLATAASIVVEALLVGFTGDRGFARQVALRCALLLAVAAGAAALVTV